jgi:subtilisin family serine protease
VGLARPLEDSIFMKKFLVICLVLTVALAHADNSKLSPDLQASSASHASVVVQYNQGPRLLDFLNLANLLGTNLSDLPLVNGIVADFPLANVNGGSSVSSSKYFTLSGTSVAAGVVSGVVADLPQKSPQLTPDQVKARLMNTAWKSVPTQSSVFDPTTGITYTDQYDAFTVGAG